MPEIEWALAEPRLSTAPPLTVWQIPWLDRDSRSGYVGLLASALAQRDVIVRPNVPGDAVWPEKGDAPDVIHLHWLEFIAKGERHGHLALVRTILRYGRLIYRLLIWRQRGTGLVWTVHNPTPHEPAWPLLERLLMRLTSLLVDFRIAHSDYVRDRINDQWGAPEKSVVIPIGNYIRAVEPPLPRLRAEARSRLGLDEEDFVFLAFGQVRPYKGLIELAEAFASVWLPRVKLVIAGKPVVPEVAERLGEWAQRDHRIVLDLRFIPDDEVWAVHAAADVAVFAYSEIFSSGALLLALSCGVPVLVPHQGSASELAQPPIVETFEPGRLSAALTRLAGSTSPDSRDVRAVAESYSWEASAGKTIAVYEAAARRRASSSR